MKLTFLSRFKSLNKKKIEDARWLSIGENCMTSDFLRRFNLFAPSTIYSHSRCNINHVLQIEEGGYKNLLNKKFLKEGTTYGGVACVFSTLIKDDNLPFEFTHVSPLKKPQKILLQARIKEMLKARSSKVRKIFCYHHRSTNGFDILMKDRLQLAIFRLSKIFNNSSFFFFTQKIIQNPSERGFEIDSGQNFILVEVKSLKKWEGSTDIFGRFDDDILKDVLVEVKNHLMIN